MTDSDAFQIVRENLSHVRDEIHRACERCGRRDGDVMLLPVTKYVDTDAVRHLYRAGIRDVGESTLQEARRKLQALEDLADLRWHFVGHLQRNKVNRALDCFASIHSLDSTRLAEAIDRRLDSSEAPPVRPRLFVEVNIGGEASKGGIRAAELLAVLAELREKTSLRDDLAGLMAVVPLAGSPEDARPHFRRLRQLRDEAIEAGLLAHDAGLSMGMSGDFLVAVEEGATVVRVGSRLFEGIPSRRR